MTLVSQKGPMGCGVACIASVSGVSYDDVLGLVVEAGGDDQDVGVFKKQALRVLGTCGTPYVLRRDGEHPGSILFVWRRTDDKWGHYLVRTRGGFWDPWPPYQGRDAHSVASLLHSGRLLPGSC